MLEFVIANYMLFIVAAIVLLLGLFGYIMDKRKYKKYREEIANEQRAVESFMNAPDIDTVAPTLLDNAQIQNNNDIPTLSQETPKE